MLMLWLFVVGWLSGWACWLVAVLGWGGGVRGPAGMQTGRHGVRQADNETRRQGEAERDREIERARERQRERERERET